MKKLLLIFAIASIFSGCNRDMFDTVWLYDTAVTRWPDGTMKTIKIRQWRDYQDGEQIQITAEDGTVYLLSSFNTVLIKSRR